MTRIARSLVLAAALLSLPWTALAAGITVKSVSSSGASTSLLAPGDLLSVDLVVDNDSNLDVFGLGLLVTGYDEDRNGLADSGLVYDSGQVAASLLNTATIPGPPPQSFGGLDNVRTTPVEQWSFDNFDPESLRLSFFDGVSLSPANGDGSLDIGIGGDLIQNGDVHFRLVFRATATPTIAPEDFTLVFGIDPEYGGVAVGDGGSLLPFTNDTVSFRVVPEPGTAMLFGLGLAGLASLRRREA